MEWQALFPWLVDGTDHPGLMEQAEQRFQFEALCGGLCSEVGMVARPAT